MHPLLLSVASLPLLFRLVPMVVPSHYLEPYAWWSGASLNEREGNVETYWRNMGYWEGTDSYPEAAEALARRLLDFANAPAGGAILDIAHGSGESLLLHLNTSTPPTHLDALTSLPSESDFAQSLVVSRHPNTTTNLQFFTSSASYRPGKDLQHPLNPMRGFMGDRTSGEDQEPSAPPYDLVYILDAIYHFQPSVGQFLAQVIHVLRPGRGVVAFTDILPPPGLSSFMGHLVLPPLLSVPSRNLVGKARTMEGYVETMHRLGYVNVEVQDWSEGVFSGLAKHLRSRGMVWDIVGRLVERADKSGWKFVAVRASRPDAQGKTRQL